MKSAHPSARKSAGRIVSVGLRALLIVIAVALPLSAQAPGAWTISGSLNTARANHAAAMLPSGQALIVGGNDGSGTALTSAEIFSLTTNSFTTLPTGLTTGVYGLTATVLNDNTVLLAGGLDQFGWPVADAELYNPTTSTFTTLQTMGTPRSHHTATLLNNQTVLIAGGRGLQGPLNSLEIYNPSTKTFSTGPNLEYPRQDHTATLLDDGTVLIAGGSNGSGPLASAEIYDPNTNTVSEVGNLNTARTLATASLLYTFYGDVLIEGGRNSSGTDLDTAELYDPTAQTFTTLSTNMITPRSGHVGVTLPYNGKVLIAGGTSGGQPVTANELYDPVAGAFVANEPLSVARDELAANFFAIPEVGQVLLSGGLDSSGNPLALTEMYAYPTIRTDMADYPPGSPVTIYGAGWIPGETVSIQIQQTNDDDVWLTDTADATGSFTDNSFGITDSDGGVKFVMTATGNTSGLTAQYRFTDSVMSVSLTNSSETVVAGGTTGNYGVTVDFSGFGTQHATLTTSTLPAGATANVSPVTGTGFPVSGTSTLTITTTCGTTLPNTYTFTVTATGSMGTKTKEKEWFR